MNQSQNSAKSDITLEATGASSGSAGKPCSYLSGIAVGAVIPAPYYGVPCITSCTIRICYPLNLGLDKDAINWGDLKCFEVVREKEGKWIAYVDEADPSAHNLRHYLQNWLAKWGWNVEVVTEW